jgi:uncharacterized repeat protein (TIGR03803 family)
MRSSCCITTAVRSLLTLFVAAMLFTTLLLEPHSVQAQTLTVLHNFTGGQDGASPRAGLSMDAAGNLYGTASTGGSSNCEGGCGAVFRLSNRGSGWTLAPLYNFTGMPDGQYPAGKLSFGPNGALFGTTSYGGVTNQNQCSGSGTGCGTIFSLRPPATFCRTAICFWTEQQLYQFTGNDDGGTPNGDIAFDSAGDLFGAGYNAGFFGDGVVWELTPSGGSWTESVPYYFSGSDGVNPASGVTLDSSGNIYGTTRFGGMYGLGIVFQLTRSGSSWLENILQNFNGPNGAQPLGGLLLDASGNIYGTTNRGGAGGLGGQAFELMPSGGSWTDSILYSFTGESGPGGDLVMDSAGNLYGTTIQEGANNDGTIFKLTPSGGSWIYTSLHDFNGQDGAQPRGSIVLDANGNLFGTTTGGGPHNQGVVWELTP